MNNWFKDLCDIHDQCYITPIMTQEHCDLMFLKNMRERCKLPGASLMAYPICVTVAKIVVDYLSSVDQGLFAGDYCNAKCRMKQSCKKV